MTTPTANPAPSPASLILPAPKARTLLGFDTETHRFSQAAGMLPPVVCLSLATTEKRGEGMVIGNDDRQALHDAFAEMFADDGYLKVGHNAGLDLGVAAVNFPDLIPAIFAAVRAGAVSCTLIREKLLQVTTTGDLEFLEMPDKSKAKLSYGMDALVKRYFGIDLSEEKNASDAWRLNFAALDGVAVEKWPAGARLYACDDASYALALYAMQEERRARIIKERGFDPLAIEAWKVRVDFCLKLMSAIGAITDPSQVLKVEAELAAELAPEKVRMLVENGILRPATPPRPHKSAKIHVEGCKKKGCTCPPKMVAGDDESIDMTVLRAYVEEFATAMNAGLKPDDPPKVKLKYTEKTEKFPDGQLSVDSEWLDDYAHLDPVLEQFAHRQALQKLVTTEIPRMKVADDAGVLQVTPLVFPQYDPLKATGRTSSFASKKADYASFNCQNVHPKVRPCFVPPEGCLFFSIDYSQMELGTLAQTCYKLFGYSVLRDKINAGVDVHAFTGAQLAFAMDPGFAAECAEAKVALRDQIADLFMAKKKGDEKAQAFYKHWRKFAKPVNLGYPGGLGPPTFVKLAKVAYEVLVDVDTAKVFRDLWKETYPEMVEYFDYVNKSCVDPFNKGWDEDAKEAYSLYTYTSPLGMVRAGCDYCACANGLGLQTPSTEGAQTALVDIVEGCFNPSKGELFGPDDKGLTVEPWGFIHDEFVGHIRNDHLVHERMMALRDTMIAAMRIITPDVKVSANPALMLRWDKAAETVFDKDGRLAVWTPPTK